jgi:hypothetical protein
MEAASEASGPTSGARRRPKAELAKISQLIRPKGCGERRQGARRGQKFAKLRSWQLVN